MRLRLACTVLAVAFATAVIGAAGSAIARSSGKPKPVVARVPQGFVGVDADGPMLEPPAGLNIAHEFDLMVASGVENVRVAFNWAAAQPYQTWTSVPAAQKSQFSDAGGQPTDFSGTDALVGLAAQHGMSVLPTVLYAPLWDATTNAAGVATPTRPAPYANFVTALVHRYGPHGSYWATHPGIPALPIRTWQIWNEPNIQYYWHQPFASGYVALLRAAHAAIKRADPGATVVLGALTNFAWRAIGQIDKIQGAHGLYDEVSVNGFTKTPSDEIEFLRLMRTAMVHLGEGSKSLLATEVSWPSAQGKTAQDYDFNTTENGQARNITALLPMLVAQRTKLRLAGFDYYTWIGTESSSGPAFSYAGLRRVKNGRASSKPALSAFKTGALAMERCRKKAAMATRCAKPVP